MRTRTMMILTGALLLVFSGAARAQQEQAATSPTAAAVPAATAPIAPKLGAVDFGYRGEDVTGEAARYQR